MHPFYILPLVRLLFRLTTVDICSCGCLAIARHRTQTKPCDLLTDPFISLCASHTPKLNRDFEKQTQNHIIVQQGRSFIFHAMSSHNAISSFRLIISS
ncbi:hypothetical protein F4805DRAFT_378689 [Annulohypoxylon moriforme]|nr:hypothetical protein F4805DRAFT_378689 [Annulohypoxylon moriforme]